MLLSFFPSFLTISNQRIADENFQLSNERFFVSFLLFCISNLTNFKAFSARFGRPGFFLSSASLRSASEKHTVFQCGKRAEKGALFFNWPFQKLGHASHAVTTPCRATNPASLPWLASTEAINIISRVSRRIAKASETHASSRLLTPSMNRRCCLR